MDLPYVLDGGVEDATLEQPFAAGPAGAGQLNWDPDDMAAAANAQARTRPAMPAGRHPRRTARDYTSESESR